MQVLETYFCCREKKKKEKQRVTSCWNEGCNGLGSRASRGEGGGSARPWGRIFLSPFYACQKSFSSFLTSAVSLTTLPYLQVCCILLSKILVFLPDMSKRPATNPNPLSHLELPLKLLECSQWRKLLFLFLQQEITARKNSRFELE